MDGPLLIFGRNGQLARALRRSALADGLSVRIVGSSDCDLAESPEAAASCIEGVRGVVNATAFTHVDEAETRTHANRNLNATAPGVMAVACAKRGVPFVHMSTDYVFSGQAGHVAPDAPTRPCNAYGAAKLAGERAVRAAGGNALILRTSWVFDGTGRNFVTTMRGLRGRDEVRVVDDQVGRPTYAGDLAQACLTALDRGWSGSCIEHFQGAGPEVSWAGFADAIFEALGEPRPEVVRIPSQDYPTPAVRPKRSVLDVWGFTARFGMRPLDWREGLRLALAEEQA